MVTHLAFICVPLLPPCSVKKGTEQAAQAAADTASNVAGSVRAGVSNIADSVRSAPDTLSQVGYLAVAADSSMDGLPATSQMRSKNDAATRHLQLPELVVLLRSYSW
jgi:hypothetical protein